MGKENGESGRKREGKTNVPASSSDLSRWMQRSRIAFWCKSFAWVSAHGGDMATGNG